MRDINFRAIIRNLGDTTIEIGKLLIHYMEKLGYYVIDNAIQPREEIKHFADGFHEGRWEDDIVENKYTHDGDGKRLDRSEINDKPIYDGMMGDYDE